MPATSTTARLIRLPDMQPVLPVKEAAPTRQRGSVSHPLHPGVILWTTLLHLLQTTVQVSPLQQQLVDIPGRRQIIVHPPHRCSIALTIPLTFNEYEAK